MQAGSNLGCNDAICAFIFRGYTMTTDFATTFEEAGLRTVISGISFDEYVHIEQESTFYDENEKLRKETVTVVLNVKQLGDMLSALVRAQVAVMA